MDGTRIELIEQINTDFSCDRKTKRVRGKSVLIVRRQRLWPTEAVRSVKSVSHPR